jgi:hypothetical protein
MSKTKFAQLGVLGCWVMVLLALPATAARITFVSFHGADNMPTTAAATAGFTAAPDKGYTDLLTSAGHQVTRFVSKNLPTAADAAILNQSDLIIVSRSVPSGHYGDPAADAAVERQFWNLDITKPVIHLGGYALRSNRLGYYQGTTIPDTGPLADGGGPVRLQAAVPAHPIFAGIPLDGTNTMTNLYANTVTTPFAPNTAQRGISVVTNPIAAGGQVLATVNTAGDLANGGTTIAFFKTGTPLAGTPASTLGAPRLVFLTGSREHNGLTSEGSGIFDLQPNGATMFLNAVRFMSTIPEPSTVTLVMVAVAGLGLIRKR